MTSPGPEVELYWIPLGAGTPIVQWNGRAYEALVSRLQRRSPCDLYHSSLIVTVDGARYTIEMTPVPDGNGTTRGVVAEGPVGLRWLGRFRVFRYEIRRWRNGVIPDLGWAMDSPRTLAEDAATAYRILDLVPEVPTPVWGLDELSAGEMWNSNSVVSWLLQRGGIDVDAVVPPPNGRAPGWDAGVAVARRDRSTGDFADTGMQATLGVAPILRHRMRPMFEQDLANIKTGSKTAVDRLGVPPPVGAGRRDQPIVPGGCLPEPRDMGARKHRPSSPGSEEEVGQPVVSDW